MSQWTTRLDQRPLKPKAKTKYNTYGPVPAALHPPRPTLEESAILALQLQHGATANKFLQEAKTALENTIKYHSNFSLNTDTLLNNINGMLQDMQQSTSGHDYTVVTQTLEDARAIANIERKITKNRDEVQHIDTHAQKLIKRTLEVSNGSRRADEGEVAATTAKSLDLQERRESLLNEFKRSDIIRAILNTSFDHNKFDKEGTDEQFFRNEVALFRNTKKVLDVTVRIINAPSTPERQRSGNQRDQYGEEGNPDVLPIYTQGSNNSQEVVVWNKNKIKAEMENALLRSVEEDVARNTEEHSTQSRSTATQNSATQNPENNNVTLKSEMQPIFDVIEQIVGELESKLKNRPTTGGQTTESKDKIYTWIDLPPVIGTLRIHITSPPSRVGGLVRRIAVQKDKTDQVREAYQLRNNQYKPDIHSWVMLKTFLNIVWEGMSDAERLAAKQWNADESS